MRNTLTLGCLLLAAVLVSTQATGETDPGALRKFVQIKCGGCHVTEIGNGRPLIQHVEGATPNFHTLAHDPTMTVNKIRKTLRLPRGGKVNLLLTEREIDEIAGYIVSLRAPPS